MELNYKKVSVRQHIDGEEIETEVLLPDIENPPIEEPVGIWGQRHARYLKEHKKTLYFDMWLDGSLHDYLVDVNDAAEAMEERLIEQYKQREGITEQLKAADQMAWVRAMNNIVSRVREVIYNELIFN